MLKYEIVVIARQDLQLKAFESEVLAMQDVLDKSSSCFVNVEYCGLRPLAYPIKKNRKGHYILVNAQINKDGLKDLQHFLYYNESVLRFFVTKVENHSEDPSLLLQQSRSYIDSTIKSIPIFAKQVKHLEKFDQNQAKHED